MGTPKRCWFSVHMSLEDYFWIVHLLATLALQGKLEEAEGLCRKALAINSVVYGNTHSSTKNSAMGLCRILEAQGLNNARRKEQHDRLIAEHGLH